MYENGFKLIGNTFEKLEEKIYTRVYLSYHIDKNYDIIYLDVIHNVQPLIFNTGLSSTNDMYETYFSLKYVCKFIYGNDISSEYNFDEYKVYIDRLFKLYTTKYDDFFNICSIENYADKYKRFTVSLHNNSEKMKEDEKEKSIYEGDYIELLFYIGRYEECVEESENKIYDNYLFCNKSDISTQDRLEYISIINYYDSLKKALLINDENFISDKLKNMNITISDNKKRITKRLKTNL